jgi:hypothetical protein
MIRVLPDYISGSEYPVYVRVTNGGAIKKEIVLPYQEVLYLDLSFAAPLLTRADRNNSDGNPAFPQQLVEIWSSNPANKITLPVFHCDETYWDTLGVDSALPQPTKPRIPNQTLDIYFPYRIHPSDAFPVEVEPVTGAPSSAIFPTTYVLGNTIDITYIKKLTIKNVWGSGLDQVINYEDRLMSDVVYDESLQCALRARWNMRNGQWFWAAFKDYFWSNKFTPIRGRGGITEQAELTINIEYGEEYYNVYQELLVSSNVVFDLNLPGINQYQSKRFRAEVIGDTGARWSNSTKTYRQQVRFKTTELQDNYMFPLAPDQPPTPSIAFTAQKNPWTVGAAYAEGLVNSIYSNAAWEVQSEPSWFTVTNGTTLFTPDMFEQGGFDLWAKGKHYSRWKTPSSTQIRLKDPVYTLEEIYSIIGGVSGYAFQVLFVDENGNATDDGGSSYATILGRHNFPAGKAGFMLRLIKSPSAPITPAEVSGMSFRYGKRYHQFPAGTSNLTATVAANTGEPRTGSIVLKSTAGATTYTIPIRQAGATGNISVDTPTFNVDYLTHPVTVNVTSFGSWLMVIRDTWIAQSASTGPNGTTTVTLTIDDNTSNDASNDARTGTIKFRNDFTGEIATVTVNQTGTPTSIGLTPFRITGSKAGGESTPVVYVSGNSWIVGDAPSWVAVSPTSGASGMGTINVTFNTANPGAARTGQLRIKNTVTSEIAVCLITQEG